MINIKDLELHLTDVTNELFNTRKRLWNQRLTGTLKQKNLLMQLKNELQKQLENKIYTLERVK